MAPAIESSSKNTKLVDISRYLLVILLLMLRGLEMEWNIWARDETGQSFEAMEGLNKVQAYIAEYEVNLPGPMLK